MAEKALTYTANDGVEVKLTPSIVAAYVASGNAQATPRDIFQFMATCQARGLNPLAGDAYLTVFKNREGGTTASTIVSKDYYMRTAAAQPDFDGIEAGVVVAHKGGALEYRPGCLVGNQTERLVGGWAKVYSKNRSHPSEAVVSLSEYNQGRNLWKSKPATMIRKVALVQALREAWPAMFSQVYDSSEIDTREAEQPQTAQNPISEPEPAPGDYQPEEYEPGQYEEPPVYDEEVEF